MRLDWTEPSVWHVEIRPTSREDSALELPPLASLCACRTASCPGPSASIFVLSGFAYRFDFQHFLSRFQRHDHVVEAVDDLAVVIDADLVFVLVDRLDQFVFSRDLARRLGAPFVALDYIRLRQLVDLRDADYLDARTLHPRQFDHLRFRLFLPHYFLGCHYHFPFCFYCKSC